MDALSAKIEIDDSGVAVKKFATGMVPLVNSQSARTITD